MNMTPLTAETQHPETLSTGNTAGTPMTTCTSGSTSRNGTEETLKQAKIELTATSLPEAGQRHPRKTHSINSRLNAQYLRTQPHVLKVRPNLVRQQEVANDGNIGSTSCNRSAKLSRNMITAPR